MLLITPAVLARCQANVAISSFQMSSSIHFGIGSIANICVGACTASHAPNMHISCVIEVGIVIGTNTNRATAHIDIFRSTKIGIPFLKAALGQINLAHS